MKVKYKYYNANPYMNETGDCVIRALSKFLDYTWEDSYSELFNKSLEMKLLFNNNKCFRAYLQENLGLKELEFDGKVKNLNINKKFKYIVLCKVADQEDCHLICIKNGILYDTSDSRNLEILSYWKKED